MDEEPVRDEEVPLGEELPQPQPQPQDICDSHIPKERPGSNHNQDAK